MEIKRTDIIDYVKTLPVSPQLKGRFRVYILDKFPSVTQFLVSSEQELRKFRCYGKTMVKLVAKVKEEFWKREHDENDRVLFDERRAAGDRVDDAAHEPRGDRPRRAAQVPRFGPREAGRGR